METDKGIDIIECDCVVSDEWSVIGFPKSPSMSGVFFRTHSRRGKNV